MKALLILITLITATTQCWGEENHEVPVLSEDEVIWETEQIGGLNEVEISPLGEVFYNTKDSIVQVRSVETGDLIDEILFPNTARLDAISISADGRYMAVSGQPEYIFIYDLVLQREVKKLTTTLLEREENGRIKKYNTEYWHNSSISPDGTKVAGVAEGDKPTSTSCWVVFDITTGEELIKNTKIGYDNLNPNKPGAGNWISSEFSPDGNFIITQSTWTKNGKSEFDSIYVHNARTFDIYDIILNKYRESRLEIKIDPHSKYLIYNDNNSINRYEFESKKITKQILNYDTWTLTFLRNSNLVIYGYDMKYQIYDIVNMITIYDYKTIIDGRFSTLDNKILIGFLFNNIYGINTNYLQTSVEDSNVSKTTISPNPTNGMVNFSLDCTEPKLVYSIYSSVGAELASDIKVKQGRDVSIDFSAYSTGVYFVSFLCSGELKTYKIIKEG